MNQLGLGVLINLFGGNQDSVKAYQKGVGKKIERIELKDDVLKLYFVNGGFLAFHDNGQSCCESRYMTTDDNLLKFTNTKFIEVTIESAPDRPTESDVHNCQFLHVKTGKGSFTVETHVEHNGYYGGFSLEAWYQD